MQFFGTRQRDLVNSVFRCKRAARREKAALLGQAQKLLDERRTERLQGKKLPETLRAILSALDPD
jgi:hypothetical protein